MVLTSSVKAFSVCLDTVTVNIVLRYHTWGGVIVQARHPPFKMGVFTEITYLPKYFVPCLQFIPQDPHY